VVVLKDPSQPTIPSLYIVLPGVGTSISMFISGVSGSYLSERAELRKKRADLNMAMGIIENDIVEEDLDIKKLEKELKKAMLSRVKINLVNKNETELNKNEVRKRKVKKTLHEKAYNFAGKFVALVNGFAPLLGGLIPMIPFIFVNNASFMTFIYSFIVIFFCIVLLGIFLGRISNESILKNILQMLFAFITTMIVVIIFLG
jgi:predicted membrane protein (TIGR00267 family)